jgi:hypothetical protein
VAEIKKMIKNFSQYLIEEEREIYFTFGRMNPPTIGHGKVMDTLASKSGKNDYRVYLSQSQNAKKDPLSYTDKIKHARKMFPKHARNIMMDKKIKNVFDIAVTLYDQGYRKINMVVGADRVREFDVLLNKYNGTKARHGFYNFEKINIISAGARDPDATGVEGMSASKQRANAENNDFVTFSQGVPKSMSEKDTRALFNDVRKGMGLSESKEFKNHVDLGYVSETRKQYVKGDLYEVGDLVIVKENNTCVEISMLGAKKSDDDSSAYKPAPGDKDAETKPSKYTKKFKDMYENVTRKQINDLEKFADRLLNKFDVDIEFTRHFADRMNDTRNNPKISIPELQRLFKKIAKQKASNIKKHGNAEVVLKDIQSDLNLPVVIKYDTKNDEFDVVNKTIMRKKGFKTSNPVVKYEQKEVDESRYSSYNTLDLEEGPDGLSAKAKKSGISVDTLKKVYNRGVAAWKTGHRPGTTPQQWGMARVNAFIVKKKKGTLNHDKDLA